MLAPGIVRKIVTKCCEEAGLDIDITDFVDKYVEGLEVDEVICAPGGVETTTADKFVEYLYLLYHPSNFNTNMMFCNLCESSPAEVVQDILTDPRVHMHTTQTSEDGEEDHYNDSSYTADGTYQTHLAEVDYAKWPLLMPSMRCKTPLHRACDKGNSAVVKALVGFAKANPSWITSEDIKGCTALHYAADANSASALLESSKF